MLGRVSSRLAPMRAGHAAVALLGAAWLAGCGGGSGVSAPDLQLVALSSQPEWVSAGDVLVRVQGRVPEGIRVQVRLNGTDVSSAFRADADGQLVGLVAGLAVGENQLELSSHKGGNQSALGVAQLRLVNHPRNGPMFSGPHEQPFACQTDSFVLADGVTRLGAPLDADCSVATRVDYVYRNTAEPPAFVALPSRTALPADVARTTTSDGRDVPYVVRVETGTLNRSIYQTALLHDPTAEPEPGFTQRAAGWNGRLVYTFGGGCTGGWYRQGANTGGVLDHNILKQGYALASSSLNVFGNNCQDLTAAESMAMVKERFIEAYGPPRYTIGWGCSGGSYQQHQIADNYPGLLDGILPGCSFPEVAFATVYSITDQRLLGHYFRDVAPGQFSDAQQAAVAGIQNVRTMYTGTVYDGAMRIAPDAYCPATLPQAQRYHPQNNPTGVRCSVYDHTANVFGRDPSTGFARRPIDNVGVQYGLQALNAGVITVDQFLDLNEKVGGYDADARFSPQRTVADTYAMVQAYQTGRLTNGGGGLRDIPIIDHRAYADDAANGDIHLRYHSFSMRERLVKANGNADNHVMLVEDIRYGYYSSASPLLMHALAQMDLWLANIEEDIAAGSAHERVVRNKPATLQEGCLTRDAEPVKIVEPQQPGAGQCAALYPAPGSPRHVAGAPIAADIIKCQLKPPTMADYVPVFTAGQQQRLFALFAGGVCDWSRPGVEQQGLRGTWLKF